MSRAEAEFTNSLSIFWLKKNGYLKKDFSYSSGGIRWTRALGGESSISFSVSRDHKETPQERAYIQLRYSHTNSWTNEESKMCYEVELVSTSCNYGGVRYWFICPLTKNGVPCGKRVGVLYSVSKWFGCRACGDIIYSAQKEGGNNRWNGVSLPDIERAEQDVKRAYYNGKPTRKYKRYIRLSRKFEQSLMGLTERLKIKSRLLQRP